MAYAVSGSSRRQPRKRLPAANEMSCRTPERALRQTAAKHVAQHVLDDEEQRAAVGAKNACVEPLVND